MHQLESGTRSQETAAFPKQTSIGLKGNPASKAGGPEIHLSSLTPVPAVGLLLGKSTLRVSCLYGKHLVNRIIPASSVGFMTVSAITWVKSELICSSADPHHSPVTQVVFELCVGGGELP